MNPNNVTPDDIAVLVFTSALNLHERALSVQKTWLRNFPKGHLVGGYYYDPSLRIISLPDVQEDYFSATPKQFLGLKALYEKYPDTKWFYILGCDGYVFYKPLCELLSKYDASKDYYIGGNFLKRNIENTDYFFPAGGPGFALSNPLVKKLIPYIERILAEIPSYHLFYEEGACDAAMGWFLLKYLNVKPVYAEGFYTVAPYKYPGDKYWNGSGEFVSEPVISNPIAFHTLTLREMYILSSGRIPKKRTFFDMVIDKISWYLSRKLKTKTLVNTIFEKVYGSTKIDSHYCIVNVADGLYVNGQNRLKESLAKCGYKGDTMFFSSIPQGWPSHDESPMGYKPLAIREALKKGYAYVLWVDANMVCVRNPVKTLKSLRKNGYFMQCEYAVPMGEWCSDTVLEEFGISREKALRIVETHSGYVGVSSENPQALALLDEWCKYALDGKTFRGIPKEYPLSETNRNYNNIVSADNRVKGHRHDQTALSYLAYKYKWKLSHCYSRNFQSLTPDGKNHYGKSISLDAEFIQSRDTKTPNYLKMIDKWGNNTGRKKIKFMILSFLETFYKRAFFIIKNKQLLRVYKKIDKDL